MPYARPNSRRFLAWYLQKRRRDRQEGAPDLRAQAIAALFGGGEQGFLIDPDSEAFDAGEEVTWASDLSGNGNDFEKVGDGPLFSKSSAGNGFLFHGGEALRSVSTIDFSASQKVTVFVELRSQPMASVSVAFETSPQATANNGAFFIATRNGGSRYHTTYVKDASGAPFVSVTDPGFPRKELLRFEVDLSQISRGDTVKIFRDGVQLSVTEEGTAVNGLNSLGNYKFNIGASNGASNFINARFGKIVAVTGDFDADTLTLVESWVGAGKTGRVASLGDSTIAAYLGTQPVSLFLSSPSITIAGAGDTINDQLTAWNALTAPDYASFSEVVIQVGLNDLNPAEAASVAIARLQSLVDQVNLDVSVPVFVATLIPVKSRLQTVYPATWETALQKWRDINQAISGGGASPITGVDGRITEHTSRLGDGAENLASTYDTGDGIHPNDLGRAIIAEEWSKFVDV